MTLAAVIMVRLGLWQLDRYRLRAGTNARIDTATQRAPAPIGQVLAPPPANAGGAGAAPAEETKWSLVRVTGRYDATHEVLARSRTVDGRVGFEVVTPLVL